MGPIGLELGVAPERLGERAHLASERACRSGRHGARRQAQGLARRGFEDGARQRFGSVDREATVVERPAERALEARYELDALEAAQADLALERRPRRDRALGAHAARLAREPAHDVEDAVHDVVGSVLTAVARELHGTITLASKHEGRGQARALPFSSWSAPKSGGVR